MKKIFLLLNILFIVISSVYAQRITERFIFINPLLNEDKSAESGNLSLINSVGGWGEFGTYISGDDEHAWFQKLEVFPELFRIGNNISFSFVSNIEFIANPHNDIKFNPRAIFWEEGFLFTQKIEKKFFQIGYFHRCKHDVDNLTEQEERILIYGGLLSKLLLPLKISDKNNRMNLTFRGELYTIRQDLRRPESFLKIEPNLKQLLGNLGINFHYTTALPIKFLGFYFNSYLLLNFFGSNEGFFNRFDKLQKTNLDGGISTGIEIQGNAHLRIGFTFEHISDSGINPYPKSVNLLSFGVTVINPKEIW